MKIELYEMGKCGISYTAALKTLGKGRIISGWHASSKDKAKSKLIKNLQEIKEEIAKTITELEK